MKIKVNDFDLLINRRNSNSLKWDNISDSAVSMWLADMDFKCPKEIIDEINSIASHGILGYPVIDKLYFSSIVNWFNMYHEANIIDKNIIPVAGVIPAIMSIIDIYSIKGDSIILQTPTYYRFFELLKLSNRKLILNPLLYRSDCSYSIDFKNLYKLKQGNPKIMILCSPHNPIGRIWSQRELEKIGDFCIDNNILLVVNEIHCDIIMPKFKFISFASLADKYKKFSILLNSPTKTFNISGLRRGNVFVFNDDIRSALINEFNVRGLNKLNTFFLAATKKGYSQCRYWLDSLINYININYQYVSEYMHKNLPQLKITPLQATYLLWISYKDLYIAESNLIDELRNSLIISPGSIFGLNGNGFIRLNIACPFKVLKRSMFLLKTGIDKCI